MDSLHCALVVLQTAVPHVRRGEVSVVDVDWEGVDREKDQVGSSLDLLDWEQGALELVAAGLVLK